MLVRGKLTVATAVAGAFVIVAAAGCGGHKAKTVNGPELKTGNLVTTDRPGVNVTIGDETTQFAVADKAGLEKEQQKHTVIKTDTDAGKKAVGDAIIGQGRKVDLLASDTTGNTTAAAADAARPANEANLLLGFPVKLLGEGQIFGGVITAVSDKASETLGRLKLVELDSLHVRPGVAVDGQHNYFLVLKGCASNCGELSAQPQLISIPIAGISSNGELLYLDLAALGKELSLIGILDPDGGYTGLKEKFSATTLVDYSQSTLVFDIVSHMIPLDADPANPATPETLMTGRWYLKLESGLNSAFEARTPAKGVGFFGTSRNKQERIVRHSITEFDEGQAPVTYLVKNVPEDTKEAFAGCFKAWNETFKEVAGRELINVKFVTDPEENKLVVAGDVRYNVVEWDLDNLAPYGGLGPSIASQNTGEIFSSNVLVQGPTIVRIYRDWFNLQAEVRDLRATGRDADADELLVQFNRKVDAKLTKSKNLPHGKVMFGKLPMRIPAQESTLEDPMAARMDFYDTPEGLTYEDYMKGYWHDLLTHELGHNMGLRHNFRGNLGSNNELTIVSSSVMEYLSRPYRHKDSIGIYDKMAIAYGYAGKQPARLDMFCTDEDVPSLADATLSAECSRDDATNDPFTMLLGHLKRSVDLGIGRGTRAAPSWTATDLSGEIVKAATGLGIYATSAAGHLAGWTNWAAQADRPTDAALVPAYVAAKIKFKLCEPSIDVVVRGKETPAAKEATLANLKAIRDNVAGVAAQLGLGDGVRCQ